MTYWSGWAETKHRLTALWNGERLERPCISITAPLPIDDSTQPPVPADYEARWLDPRYVIRLVRYTLESTWWGGESIPGVTGMANWVNCLGGTPSFASTTIWFETRSVDFDLLSPFRHDPDNPWTAKHKKLLLALCAEAGRGAFMVGGTGGLPANDLLSMLMGTQEFLLALIDHPLWMAEAILAGARDQVRAGQELEALIRSTGHEFWYGGAGWMPFWAPEPYCGMQSDVSCMLSPEQYDRFVLPELELCAETRGPIWYHLDGGDAKQHLPRLLSLPFLRVVQYTPRLVEPPNGPAHMEMYKRVQAAGKIIHIEVPAESVEPMVRELDPTLLMLHTQVPSRAEGERLLERCVEWARASK